MGNNITEKSIVNSCLRWARKLPCSKFRKRKGGVTNPGEPDIYGCIFGLHVEIEMKAPGGKPTKLQERRIVEWSNAGCFIKGIAYSLYEFKEIIIYGLKMFISCELSLMEEGIRDFLKGVEK